MSPDNGNCGMWQPREAVLDQLTCGCHEGYMSSEGTFITGDDIRAGLALRKDEYDGHQGCGYCARDPAACRWRRAHLRKQPVGGNAFQPITGSFQMFVPGNGISQGILKRFLEKNNPDGTWLCMPDKIFKGRDGFWVCSRFRLSTSDITQLKILTRVYRGGRDIQNLLGRPLQGTSPPFTEMTQYLSGLEENEPTLDDMKKLCSLYMTATTQLEKRPQQQGTSDSYKTANLQPDTSKARTQKSQRDDSPLTNPLKRLNISHARDRADKGSDPRRDRRHQDIVSREDSLEQTRDSSKATKAEKGSLETPIAGPKNEHALDQAHEEVDSRPPGQSRHSEPGDSGLQSRTEKEGSDNRHRRHGPYHISGNGHAVTQSASPKRLATTYTSRGVEQPPSRKDYTSQERHDRHDPSYSAEKGHVVVNPARSTRRGSKVDARAEELDPRGGPQSRTGRGGRETDSLPLETRSSDRQRHPQEDTLTRRQLGKASTWSADSTTIDPRSMDSSPTDSRTSDPWSIDSRSTDATTHSLASVQSERRNVSTDPRSPGATATGPSEARPERLTFFVPADKIDLDPLTSYVKLEIDPEATVRSGTYQQRPGYLITAKRAINKKELEKIIMDTRSFREKRGHARMPYTGPETAERRHGGRADQVSRGDQM